MRGIPDSYTRGEYENHHLLCPRHGRTTASGDGETASCGCGVRVLWLIWWHGESEMYRTDNMGIGSRVA